MKDIKLIAFDLDGTLFTTDKRITQRTYDALRAANDRGVAIVPATVRFMQTIPESIKKMDYIRYLITINGAYVYSCKKEAPIYRAEIKLEKAIEILKFLDGFPVAYDCYTDNGSYMNRDMMEHITDYVQEPFYLKMLHDSRNLVDELKTHLMSRQKDIQKMMAYTVDPILHEQLMKDLAERFDNITITSSLRENIEINDAGANKGIAVKMIAEDMGITMDQVMTFGDSYNDIPMLEAAGYGVCMDNGVQAAKDASQIIAPSNDEEGVAYIIEKEVLGM